MIQNVKNLWSSTGSFLLRNLRAVLSISFVFLAILEIFVIDISWIALVIIALAVLPWTIDFVKSASIPGFGEVDTISLANAIKNIEEREPRGAGAQPDLPAPQEKISAEMMLALGRRELEIKLRRMIGEEQEFGRSFNIPRMAHKAYNAELISDEERSIILDLLPIMNQAVHGRDVPPTTAEKALSLYLDLNKRLDQRGG